MSNTTATRTGCMVNDELDEKYNCAALILDMDEMMTICIISTNDIKISTVKFRIYF